MKINETIEDILMYQKHTRDCDYYLYNQILKLYDAQNITALELLKAMKNKTIPSFESVSRARRQLQQMRPDLRGVNWMNRQTTAQDKRKKELGYV